MTMCNEIHIPDRPGRHRMACPRCNHRAGDTALSVKVEPDGSACWMCFRCDWRGSSRSASVSSPEDRRANHEAKQAEERKKHYAAAMRARGLWRNARPANPDHEYLKAKGVQAFHARQLGQCLMLPLVDMDAKLHSLQFISADGNKRMIRGGRKKGCAIPVHGRRGASRIIICEGWATGATLAQIEPHALVLAAVDAGNLEPVSVECRRRWPNAEIFICGDADKVGRAKSESAALACGGRVVIPDIPPEVGSDWNDAARLVDDQYLMWRRLCAA